MSINYETAINQLQQQIRQLAANLVQTQQQLEKNTRETTRLKGQVQTLTSTVLRLRK